jgi:hypothetical protein
MPKETIRRLGLDVERIIVAGAHLAKTDTNIAKSRTAIAALATQFGAKAPVITQLAAATAKVVDGPAKDTTREVVGLATMTAQVRAAQAAPAPAPATTPLATVPEVGTPCNAKNLLGLFKALTESGSGRLEVVKGAIERGEIADLRLVDALVHAMGDGYIGDTVTDQAIPLLGAAVIAPLRAQLHLTKAAQVNARRLRALVRVQGDGARDILTQALEEGSADMREAAFDLIADFLPGRPEFEAPALAAIAKGGKERSADVRRAALRALGGYASAYEAILEALDDERTFAAAVEALGRSRDAMALDQLLKRLGEAVAEHQKLSAAGTTKPDDNRAMKAGHHVALLLKALGNQVDPRSAAAAMALIGSYGAVAAEAALASADHAQIVAIANLISGKDNSLFHVAATAIGRLPRDEAFAIASGLFKKPGGDLVAERLVALRHVISTSGDERWVPLLLGLLAQGGSLQIRVIETLGTLKDARALAPLKALLAATPDNAKSDALTMAIFDAFGDLGDPSTVPLMLARAGGRHGSNYAVYRAIIAINHVSSVEQVRAVVAAGTGKGWYLASLLSHLERRFPGH